MGLNETNNLQQQIILHYIDFRPLPEDDPKVRQPDITRAKMLLNWEPKVDFAEGIAETIDYFRNKV